MRIPTVIIETENGPVVINERDYDATKHTLQGSSSLTPINDELNTDNSGASAPAGATDGTGSNAPAGEQTAPATAGTNAYSVGKSGKKFIVMNADGPVTDDARINEKGYATENEAWAAIGAIAFTPQT